MIEFVDGQCRKAHIGCGIDYRKLGAQGVLEFALRPFDPAVVRWVVRRRAQWDNQPAGQHFIDRRAVEVAAVVRTTYL